MLSIRVKPNKSQYLMVFYETNIQINFMLLPINLYHKRHKPIHTDLR